MSNNRDWADTVQEKRSSFEKDLEKTDDNPPAIIEGLQLLHSAIEGLDSHLDLLFDKIRPVLGPETDVRATGLTGETSPCSDIAESLFDKARTIQRLSAHVVEIRSRIEL